MENNETKTLPNKAYSLVKKGNTYTTVEITFDLDTQEVGSLRVVAVSESRMHGIESFKIAVSDAKLFTDGL